MLFDSGEFFFAQLLILIALQGKAVHLRNDFSIQLLLFFQIYLYLITVWSRLLKRQRPFKVSK